MDNEQTKLTAYQEFARLVFAQGNGASRIPLAGSIDLTDRCNLKCAHCYIAGVPFQGEMTYEQISQVINCKLGTVKSRIHYAKLALKKEMEK